MAEYVAVTQIQHGKEDGSTVTFSEGDVVEGLDKDVMQAFYTAGSIAVKGSKDDPNLLEYPNRPGQTTPAMVQDSLQAQVRLAAGPAGKDDPSFKAALTQPNEDAPSSPEKLLGQEKKVASAQEAPAVQGQTKAPAEKVESK